MSMTPICGHCGKFCRPVDRYAPWGGAGDQEPPDPVDLCARCAHEEYEAALAACLRDGLPPIANRPAYVPSWAYLRARAVARAMFRHGTPRPVLHAKARDESSGTRKVWWCRHCRRPERHPAHDLTEARRLHVTYCHFEKAVGRNIGTLRVQEWCCCGWTTGPLVPDREHPQNVDYLGSGRLLREHVERASGYRRRSEVRDGRLRDIYEHLIDGEWVEWDPLREAVSA